MHYIESAEGDTMVMDLQVKGIDTAGFLRSIEEKGHISGLAGLDGVYYNFSEHQSKPSFYKFGDKMHKFMTDWNDLTPGLVGILISGAPLHYAVNIELMGTVSRRFPQLTHEDATFFALGLHEGFEWRHDMQGYKLSYLTDMISNVHAVTIVKP